VKQEAHYEPIRIDYKTVQVRAITALDLPIVLKPGFARIASIKDEWRFDIKDPERIVSEITHSDLGASLFTFSQRLPLTEPLFGHPRKWENLAALPISSYEEWWQTFASQAARNKIRKARRMGVEVRVVEYDEQLVRGIESIYNESPIRQGKRFAHYKKDFGELWRIHETFLDRATFLGAFFRNELIGFVKLVDAGPFIRTMGLISKIAHSAAAPNSALIDAAVALSCQKRTKFLVYGEFDWGKRGGSGLTEFKKGIGFQKVMLPRYYIPLTRVGKLILATGLENGVIEKLPKPVVRSLLEVRRVLIALKSRFSRPA
jgi:hypothetical protein